MLQALDPIAALNAKARAAGWTFSCERGVQFDAPKLDAVNALWRSLARSCLPSRADFSLRALKGVLPDLMIADVVRGEGDLRFRFRYVGSRVVSYFGEMTGRFLDEHLPPPVHERTAPPFETIVAVREPLRFVTRFSMDGIDFLSAEFFGAPLASDGIVPDMVMTATEFHSRR